MSERLEIIEKALIYLPFFNILPMLQRSTADLPCCDRCQWTSRDSAITYLRDISMVAWVFAIEW